MASTSNREQADSFLRSRVEDCISLCDRRNKPSFFGFLDEAEQAIVLRALKGFDQDRYAFFGGFEDAERRILGIFPDYMPPQSAAYPLVSVAFYHRSDRALTHRDFLGTILSQGIKRESVGDILCSDKLTVVFLRAEIADFICEQITKVGGVGVKVVIGYDGELPSAHTFEPIQDTVASPRLDVVTKVLLRCAREKASQLIVDGAVSIDHSVVADVSATVSAPCVVSIRGKGRFMIDAIGPPTKKGRLYLNARKCV